MSLNGGNIKAPKEILTVLNELGNNISIVFQNDIDYAENILFTGDINKASLNRIKRLTDYPLHKKYKYIKIPHHGTINHYWDFKPYKPVWCLIPNGKVKSRNDSYKICSKYANVGNSKLCSNGDNCMCYDCEGNQCMSCRHVIAPNLFIQI